MALSDNRNTNDGARKNFDRQYYSRLHFSNYSTNKRINISYSAGLMRISIAVLEGDKYEEKITVNLTGLKAAMFLNAISKFEDGIKNGEVSYSNAAGVTTGVSEVNTIIALHLAPSDDSMVITIAKIDKTGSFVDRYDFEFAKNSNYGIWWNNLDSMDLEKDYNSNNNLEYEMFKKALKEFTDTYSGAAGYNTIDLRRYDYNSMKNSLETVMDKLGIPVQKNFTRRSNYNGGFFDNNTNSSNNNSQHKNFEDIESMIDDDDEE